MKAHVKHYQQGFTLLEIMLVVFLIGITTTLGFMYSGTNHKQLNSTATQLLLTLQQTLDKAVEEEKIYGLLAAEEGWQIMAYTPSADSQGAWQQVGNTYYLPDEIELSLYVESHSIALTQKVPANALPQLWFYPSGETHSFTVKLIENQCIKSVNAQGFMNFMLSEINCHAS